MTDQTADILKARGTLYGDFTDHARITQMLKDIMKQTPAWRDGISLGGGRPGGLGFIHREALEMIVHKIGRILNGDPNYADSWDDIAGYARLVADRVRPNPGAGQVAGPGQAGLTFVSAQGGATLQNADVGSNKA